MVGLDLKDWTNAFQVSLGVSRGCRAPWKGQECVWDKWTNEHWRLVAEVRRRGWKTGTEVDYKGVNSILCIWLGSVWKNR